MLGYLFPDSLLNHTVNMPRNVEIKAAVHDVHSLLQRARRLSNSEGTTFKQEDTFFKVPHGRLKLRVQDGSKPQLVFYNRPDTDGPKLSDYEVCHLEENTNLSSVLRNALGVKGVLRKVRTLFMVGQTRVHVDDVEGLGHFMELEVVLNDTETVQEGQKIAEDLMEQLGVSKSDLITGAYMDHILQKGDIDV